MMARSVRANGHGFRSLTAVGCWLAAAACMAGDRPTMTGPPAGLESAKQLSGSIADACNRKDFIGFMSHFSPRQAGRIRRRMEDNFTQYDIEMEIEDVILLSEEKDRLVFGVRYVWHERSSPRRTLASRVTAIKSGGEWKVDAEEVQRIRAVEPSGCSSCGDREVEVVFGGRNVGGCANGQCCR